MSKELVRAESAYRHISLNIKKLDDMHVLHGPIYLCLCNGAFMRGNSMQLLVLCPEWLGEVDQ
jgi:hypothetical protein